MITSTCSCAAAEQREAPSVYRKGREGQDRARAREGGTMDSVRWNENLPKAELAVFPAEEEERVLRKPLYP